MIAGIKQLTDVPGGGDHQRVASQPRRRCAGDWRPPTSCCRRSTLPSDGLFQLVNRPHEALRFADVVDGMVAFRARLPRAAVARGHAARRRHGDGGRSGAARGTGGAHRPRPYPAEHGGAPTGGVVRGAGRGGLSAGVRRSVHTPRRGDRRHHFRRRRQESRPARTSWRSLSRRPCTVADIAAGLGIHHGEALKAATALVNEGAAGAARPRRSIVLRWRHRRR